MSKKVNRRSMSDVERMFRKELKAILQLFVYLWKESTTLDAKPPCYFSQNDLRRAICEGMHEAGYEHDLPEHEIMLTGFVEAANTLVGGPWIEYNYSADKRGTLKNVFDYYRLSVNPLKETLTQKYLGNGKAVETTKTGKVEDLPMTFNKNDIKIISKLIEMKNQVGEKNFFMIVDSLR